MGEYYWDSKIEYLKNTRWLMYNDDYIEFLVNSVWKINNPIHMIDFGCGYGYLGLKLLPLLPKGSKYTGVDAGVQLINHAKEIYKDSPFETEFIVGDIQTIILEQKYDMALCHSFLMHVPNPKEIVQKMINSVVDQGTIVCFESNWIANMANYYYDGIVQSKVIPLGLLQKIYELDAKREGKDGNIGIKLPIYLSQLGVKNVQCRVSDKVNFLDLSSEEEDMDKLFQSLQFTAPGEQEVFISNLIDRGLTLEEAQHVYEAELLLSETFVRNTYLTYAPNMKITFGKIVR
jgi:SAM-dependent methyltransferase